jgi:hypothetical protein
MSIRYIIYAEMTLAKITPKRGSEKNRTNGSEKIKLNGRYGK